MRNTSKIKRVLALCLIFLLSINSFAASDNDGSAFITKAEFDSLKNNFQSQIDSYNQGIDSKIDGAIAAYLANVDLSGDITDRIADLNMQTGNKFRFINTTLTTGNSTITTDLKVDINFDIYKITPVVYDRVRARNEDSPGIYYDIAATLANLNGHDNTLDVFHSAKNGKQSSLPSTWATTYCKDLDKVEVQNEYKNKTESEQITSGSGSVWEYYKKPNGDRKLVSFNTDYYPIQTITGNWHYYKLYWVKNSTATYTQAVLISYIGTSTGADLGLSKTITIDSHDTWGQWSGGTSQPTTSTTEGTWWSTELSKMQAKDPTDWEVLQLSGNTSSKIYCMDQNKKLTVASKTSKTMDITYNEKYCDPTGPSTRDVDVGSMNVEYYPVSYTPEQLQINTFINDILTGVNGEKTYLGGGTKLCIVPKESKVKVTLDLVLENSSGTAKSGNIAVYIGDKQFKDGAFVSGATKHVNGEVAYVTTATDGGKKSWTFECKEKENVWINLEPSVVGDSAYIKTATYEYVD